MKAVGTGLLFSDLFLSVNSTVLSFYRIIGLVSLYVSVDVCQQIEIVLFILQYVLDVILKIPKLV